MTDGLLCALRKSLAHFAIENLFTTKSANREVVEVLRLSLYQSHRHHRQTLFISKNRMDSVPHDRIV